MSQSKAGILVRQADLRIDRERILETIARYLAPDETERRFDWLYVQNPHGAARAWLALDPESAGERVVGMAAAFPRQLNTPAGPVLGWVLGDFCIAPEYRALGPAIKLQKACLEGIACASGTLWYDFPAAAMMAVYNRLGFKAEQSHLRWAMPLRTERQIAARLRSRTLGKVAGAAANMFLSIARAHALRPDPNVRVSLQVGPCGEEFTRLALHLSSEYRVCVQRTPEYLNWRYISHPAKRYEIVKAHRGIELAAFAVFTSTPGHFVISDLFGSLEHDLLGTLFKAIARIAYESGAGTLSVPLMENDPLAALLAQFGFRQREKTPVMVMGPKEPTRWFLCEGDRES